MQKMDLKQKLCFKTINDRILYMLRNNIQLDYAELEHIFLNCARQLRPNYAKLCRSVRTLLKETDGDALDALVQLLNADFEYEPAWYVDISTLEDRFELWQYKCTNPETKKVLIQTAEDFEKEKKNKPLNKFKQIIGKGE